MIYFEDAEDLPGDSNASSYVQGPSIDGIHGAIFANLVKQLIPMRKHGSTRKP